ncbi:MAG: lipid-A-disaccharide synthase-related protein [Brevinema sp.]
MTKKIICVIANGYAEEMIAANLMSEIVKELKKHGKDNEYQLIGGSLVSSGKWFQEKGFATFFAGGVTPSGGFPTKSLGGFFNDMNAGAFSVPFKLRDYLVKWGNYYLSSVIVVGDFLLMMIGAHVCKQQKVPLVFIPTAKSDYIQSHFRIEKKYIKKHATISYPRDQVTADNFREYGINAAYYGNMIQDLFDPNTTPLQKDDKIVALLPGSRDEAYKNIAMMLPFFRPIVTKVHWAMLIADSLDRKKVNAVFEAHDWTVSKVDDKVSVARNGGTEIYLYPNSSFDTVIASCYTAVSLAGTGTEQIVGLGKPVIGFKGAGPQSCHARMIANQKLLGEGFVYVEKYTNVASVLQNLLHSPSSQEKLGLLGKERMGEAGGSARIAKDIVAKLLLKTE